MAAHERSSNAARLAATAVSTSAKVAFGMVAITSPLEGSSTSPVAPSEALVHAPPIHIDSSSMYPPPADASKVERRKRGPFVAGSMM